MPHLLPSRSPHPKPAAAALVLLAAAGLPACSNSWVLVSARQPSQHAGQALVTLLGWLTHAGQYYAGTLGYVPLPTAIQQLATTTLARATSPDGKPLGLGTTSADVGPLRPGTDAPGWQPGLA